ncbi:MAG: DUF933 domain-containing protein [Phycisphaerae bacterium]|jgi:hypothetical protein
MRVALVGPIQSGKSSLFAAVAQAGGSAVHLDRPDQPHLAVVKVPDPRVEWLAEHYKPKKVTHAELELLDLPGMDLSDEAGRTRAKALWPAMRQSDMLVFVLRTFANEVVAPYRGRIDPLADLQELQAEMLFADLEQVLSRIEKLNAGIKKPGGKRDELLREMDLMNRLKEALENEKPIGGVVSSEAEAKLLRSFAFLSIKPQLVAINCDEQAAATGGPAELSGVECIQLSAKIESELSLLPEAERSEFLADLGLPASASDRMVRACYSKLNLISFLTAGEDECRAWTIPAGTDAVTAAGAIHSDIARGFIRAETVHYDDLHATGDMKAARAAGKIRLEGKNYPVQDGDIINFRFNV